MIDTLMPMIKQFLPFAQERMGFQDPPRLFVREDNQNAENPLGKTAFYDPSVKSVTLYVTGRHPKDIMRSLSHELVHHTQCCDGQFDNVGQMGDGYAQNDTHLREMERQAYEIGNLCFRDWEDSIKHTIYFEHLQKGVEKVMSTKQWKNGELKSLLSEAWGFKMDLSKLNEGTGPSADDEDEDKKDIAGKDPSGETKEKEGKGWEAKGLEEMCPDAEGAEVVVMGDEMPGDEGPEEPAAIVDELSDLVARLSAVLGGGEETEEEEVMVDIQERLRKAFRKALLEAGGDFKGDKGKDEDDPEAHDYEHGGDREGDESETHPGTDYSKRHPHHKVPDAKDDSDDSEKEHYKVNAMSDDDHIKAIEHHLDALRKDRDYDEEKEEDLEERRARGRADPRNQRGPKDARQREALIRRAVKEAIQKSIKK